MVLLAWRGVGARAGMHVATRSTKDVPSSRMAERKKPQTRAAAQILPTARLSLGVDTDFSRLECSAADTLILASGDTEQRVLSSLSGL